MSNLRQAAQDVLELVEWIKDRLDVVRTGGDIRISPILIDKLRAALAEPEQEPSIRWDASAPVLLNDGRITQYPNGDIGVGTPAPRQWQGGREMTGRELMQQALDEMLRVNSAGIFKGELNEAITALRAALAEPERKPLTDEQISRIWGSYLSRGLEFARAIERAHGIEEQEHEAG
jgi:hypothetical protein